MRRQTKLRWKPLFETNRQLKIGKIKEIARKYKESRC